MSEVDCSTCLLLPAQASKLSPLQMRIIIYDFGITNFKLLGFEIARPPFFLRCLFFVWFGFVVLLGLLFVLIQFCPPA